jgi:hypothetical protein
VKRDKWEYDERVTLAVSYMAGGVAAACAALPHRSKARISVQASNWGVAAAHYFKPDPKCHWSKDEDWIVKHAWDTRENTKRNTAFVHILLPHRTETAIQQRYWCIGQPVTPRYAGVRVDLPVEERDDVIIAHRIWNYVDVGNFALLESIQTRTLWPAGAPLVAHKLDPYGHSSGIHAFKTQQTPEQYTYAYSQKEKPTLIRGTVYLWGDVYEFDRGYRAQYAYPAVIACQTLEQAQKLRRTYGCETFAGPWKGLHATSAAN